MTGSLAVGRRLQHPEAGLGENRLLGEPEQSQGCPVLPLLPIWGPGLSPVQDAAQVELDAQLACDQTQIGGC